MLGSHPGHEPQQGGLAEMSQLSYGHPSGHWTARGAAGDPNRGCWLGSLEGLVEGVVVSIKMLVDHGCSDFLDVPNVLASA